VDREIKIPPAHGAVLNDFGVRVKCSIPILPSIYVMVTKSRQVEFLPVLVQKIHPEIA
jgi:hypothetical protein